VARQRDPDPTLRGAAYFGRGETRWQTRRQVAPTGSRNRRHAGLDSGYPHPGSRRSSGWGVFVHRRRV